MDTKKREFGAWWAWVVLLATVTIVAVTGLSYAGVIGRTVVEREVFEQSFQYTAARRAEIATYEAQIASLEVQERTADERAAREIASQLAAIRIRLAVAKGVGQ